MSKETAYDFLLDQGYPEHVLQDMFNFFDSTVLSEFVDFVKSECGLDDEE